MSRKVLLILALVLLHSATASGQWFDAAWVCRRSVKITETKADGKDAEVASVVFSPGDLLTLDGRDIRVVTKSGKEVPLVVITADPSAECRVLFKIQPGVTEYHVYYGNLKAEAPKYGWRPRTGILLLEVPNPPGGFRGNNFVQHVDEFGLRTGLTRDAWKTKRVPAWPKPPATRTSYTSESIIRKPIRGRNGLFVFRIEVKPSDKPFWVKKLGQGIGVNGILFLDNAMHVIAGGPQPVYEKLLALKPGLHSIEAWGGALKFDDNLRKYVPFTHDTSYTLPEAKTTVGGPQYQGGNVTAAYNKIAGQLNAETDASRMYWLDVAGIAAHPAGKAPSQLLSRIDKFEARNWAAEWRAFGGGPTHVRTGTLAVTMPLQLARGTVAEHRSEPKTQPVIYGGSLLVGGGWGNMKAHGRWSANFFNPISSTAACIGDRVFFGAHNNNIYALDFRSGRPLWETPTGLYVRSSPAVWRGNVYVGCNDKNLYALSGASGKILWKFETGGWIESSPAVVGGVVYFGSYDHYFYAVDATTGKLRWKFKTGYDCVGSPVVVGNDVVFGSDDGFVYCLNRGNGSQRWKFKAGGFLPGTPAVSAGKVYVGTTKGKVFGINISNGQKVWEAGGLGELEHGVVAAANVVIAAARDGKMYALDVNSGQRLSTFDTHRANVWQLDALSAPAVTPSGLIIVSAGGWTDHRDFLGRGAILWFKVAAK